MLQLLKTHKKPMSLIIKETFFALNIFFILTILLTTIVYFYILSRSNTINYKQVQITLTRKNLQTNYDLLQSQILNISSHEFIKKTIFENPELNPVKDIKFLDSRKNRLETKKSLANK